MLERYTGLRNSHRWVDSSDYRNVTDELGIDPSSVKREFVDRVTSSLGVVVDDLLTMDHFRKDTVDRIWEGIIRWLGDRQHGVEHSFHVDQGAKTLRNREHGIYSKVPDSDLLARAALHDMAEFLPMVDKAGRLYFPDDTKQRRIARIHPRAIAKVVGSFARILNIPQEDWNPLVLDIKLQDISFERPTVEKVQVVAKMLSPAGRLFNDADRLAGAGELDSPNLIRDSVNRNRVGSLGKWYMLRNDLDDDRWEWQMRTGGFYDGLSALLAEFIAFTPAYAYTLEGKRIALERRKQFPKEFMEYYESERIRGRNTLIPVWQDQTRSIEIGIKEEKSPNGIIGINEESAGAISRMQFPAAMQTLMKIPVQEKGSLNGRKWFGWSLRFNGEWFDPSILQFDSGSEFNAAFSRARDGYQRLMQTKLNVF